MSQKYYYLPAGEMVLATPEEAKDYFDRAKAFVESTKMYGSTMTAATMAVAEYMAYQDDKTLRIP